MYLTSRLQMLPLNLQIARNLERVDRLTFAKFLPSNRMCPHLCRTPLLLEMLPIHGLHISSSCSFATSSSCKGSKVNFHAVPRLVGAQRMLGLSLVGDSLMVLGASLVYDPRQKWGHKDFVIVWERCLSPR